MKTQDYELPAVYVYRLTNGKIVHTLCREPYVKLVRQPHGYIGIDAALYPGFQMPEGRFQICAHCQRPIWSLKP